MVFAFAAATLRPYQAGVGCASAALISAALFLVSPCAGQSVALRAPTAAGGHQQVRVIVEVEGKLKLNPDGKEVQHIPITAAAELHYVERTLPPPEGESSLRAVRYYEKAEAKIRLRDSELINTLRDERRLIVLDGDQPQPILFSPLGPLACEELELIDVPASSLSLASLLPGDTVKTGSGWDLDNAVVQRLLGLEAVNQQSITGTLASVEKDLAIVSLEGTVAGAVGGVSSDIELKGKLNFDLRKQVVTWLVLAIKENRAIGHAQPGFEVVTKLRMVAGATGPAAEVADKALAGLPTAADTGQSLIELTSEKAGFQLVHDRRWRVMVERHDATILRLVDRGDLIAQCNISPLPPLPKGQQLPLEGFQNDVKQALGENFGQVVEAAQEEGEEGLFVQRVTVSGTAGELPIQWTYYHVFDGKGHRASLVFTIEGNLVERFAQIDRELISGFRFLQDKEPTPAVSEDEKSAQKPEMSKTK